MRSKITESAIEELSIGERDLKSGNVFSCEDLKYKISELLSPPSRPS